MSFQSLIISHVNDIKKVNSLQEYKDIITRHAFELSIFPRINCWNIGQRVMVSNDGEGVIQKLLSNGCICILIDGTDMPRDYTPSQCYDVTVTSKLFKI